MDFIGPLILFVATFVLGYLLIYESWFRKWLSCHREWFYLAAVAGLAWWAWDKLPSVDPYTDLKNVPGDLGNLLVLLGRGLAAVIAAYLCKAWFTTDLSDDEEARLRRILLSTTPEIEKVDPASQIIQIQKAVDPTSAIYGQRTGALYLLVSDRLGWLPWLGFWFFALFRS